MNALSFLVSFSALTPLVGNEGCPGRIKPVSVIRKGSVPEQAEENTRANRLTHLHMESGC